MKRVIEKFISEMALIEDKDSREFMRKAGLYFNQLREDLSLLADDKIKSKFAEIQSSILDAPIWRIEPTRRKVIQDAKLIDILLQNVRQEWEFATPEEAWMD